ncbi:hypothetical protein [Dyadobacter beijingensis]|nr:hypothetical protein [Dyadobacter beijingensis]
MSSLMVNPTDNQSKFTPLGEIFFEADAWKRAKINSEVLAELGLKRSSVRAYMVSTPAYRMREDMKEIILRTLPEAAKCFTDPRIKKAAVKQSSLLNHVSA